MKDKKKVSKWKTLYTILKLLVGGIYHGLQLVIYFTCIQISIYSLHLLSSLIYLLDTAILNLVWVIGLILSFILFIISFKLFIVQFETLIRRYKHYSRKYDNE